MSEETKEVQAEQLQNSGSQTTTQTEQQDPFEAKAMEMGWRPQEEWEGDPEDFVDAKEYVRRQPLFDKISSLNKQLKKLEQGMEAFKVHHKRVKDSEFQRAYDALKLAKRQALRDGETDQVLALEDKLEEIQAQHKEFEESLPETPKTAEAHPAFVAWRQQNAWYQKDRAMTAFADKLGVELHQQGLSPDEVLQQITKEIRTEFKHKFTNPKRDTPSPVEGGSRKATKSSEDSFSMPEDDKRIMDKLIRSGAMTKEEYIKEYKRVQGL